MNLGSVSGKGHSYCCLSYNRSVAAFESEFSTVCDLVLPLSVAGILSFP